MDKTGDNSLSISHRVRVFFLIKKEGGLGGDVDSALTRVQIILIIKECSEERGW